MRSTPFLLGAALTIVMFCSATAIAGSVSAAKTRVAHAKELQAAGRNEEAGRTLDAAEKFLEGLTDAEKAPILADIKAIREKMVGALTPEQERSITAAKGKLRRARSEIESGYGKDDVETTLKGAEAFLAGVPDANKKDLLEEIKKFRKGLAGGAKDTPKPADGTPAKPAAATSEDQAVSLSKAKGLIRQANSLTETRRTENVPGILDDAEALLTNLPEEQRIALAVEIAAVRKQARDTDVAEKVRSLDEEISRHIGSAESNLGNNASNSADGIQRATKRLADADAQQYLTAAQLQAYETRLDAVKKKLAASNKADAMDRAESLLKQIEDQLADDPFKGKGEREAYSVHSGLQSLRKGALSWIADLPADDADAKALRGRIEVADQKVAKAEAAWGKAVLDAQVGGSWDVIKKDIEGWDQETADPKSQPLDSPNLPKTGIAITRIGYWLNSDETKKTRAENKGDATLDATYGQAEKVFEGAAAKLAAEYDKVLAAAEKMPTPMRRFELDRPVLLAVSADYALAGTKQKDAVVARARKLDEKWKAEVAAIMKARQELYDKLAAEAEVKWPAIVASINPVREFDPAKADALRGKAVLLKGVYNRSGWDFSGRNHAFAMRRNDTPIGGNYEPHVLKALEHAWYELKLDVNDRIEWDVVAIVEGPGKIGERVFVTLKDRDTGLEIGKLEEYRPIDCVNVKIIALHAGPVAVGPGK